jgi:hypothetical protein
MHTNVSMSIGLFTKYHKSHHILHWNLFLNLTLYIQHTHKCPQVNLSIYQIPYKIQYLTLKVISEPHTPSSVYTQTSPCQSVSLPNTIKETISYTESYFWTSHAIFSIHTNVPMSIGPFTKYHTKYHTLHWKLLLNLTLHIQHTPMSPCQSVPLPNTKQNTISYTERSFWTLHSIFSIHTNVPMSIGPFTKYQTKYHTLHWKLFLNLTLHLQYTHKRFHVNRSLYQIQ